MKRARIARDQHKCRGCHGWIYPGHVYHEETWRDERNPTRFKTERLCAECHNGSVEPPAVHGCATENDAFWEWMREKGYTADTEKRRGLEGCFKEWKAELGGKS